MSAQHGRPQGGLSTRRTREGEHHSKDRGSKRVTLAQSKTVARFIYGSNSHFLRRQHLQDILGASGALPSLEVATPSFARTHFYQTSRPRQFLRATCPPPRERELGGDVRRVMQLEELASVPDGGHILRPASPATRTAKSVHLSVPSTDIPFTESGSYLRLIDSCITQLKAQHSKLSCMSTPSSAAHRHALEVAITPSPVRVAGDAGRRMSAPSSATRTGDAGRMHEHSKLRRMSTPSSAAHRHAPEVAIPPAARTLKMTASSRAQNKRRLSC